MYFDICTKPPLNLLFRHLTCPISLSISSLETCSSLCIIFMDLPWALSTLSMSLVLRIPALDPAVWLHPCQTEGQDLLPPPAGSAVPNAAQDRVYLLY